MYEPACITDSAIRPSGIGGRSWMWMLLNPLRQRRVPILGDDIMQPCAIRDRRAGVCSKETGKQKGSKITLTLLIYTVYTST